MEFKGTTAIVTGGAKGLGLAIAHHLQEQGTTVIVIDHDVKAMELLPESFHSYCLDVTQPVEVRKTIKNIVKNHGKIEILINNAGAIYSEPFLNLMNPEKMMHDYDTFRQSITVNLDSVFIMSSAVIEHMVRQRIKGVIINISSISACGNEGQTAYSAAKAGVNAMTVTWSKELGRLGIRCNAIAPGFIATESTHNALNESILKHIKSNTPLGRLGHPHNIAQAVASLIANDFINGAILPVNGGLTI